MMITPIQTIGYNKDKFASILFFFAFFFIYFIKDLNSIREVILASLFIGFIVDLTFTLNPKFHFISIGNNTPTYIVFLGLFVFSIIFTIHHSKFKFL